MILNRGFYPRFEFQGLGIAFEIHGTARVLPPLQYPGDRFCTPLIKILRHGPAFLHGVIGGSGQYLVGCEDFCDQHGTFPGNAEVKDTLAPPLPLLRLQSISFILRIFYVPIGRIAGDMLPGFPPHLYHCPDFLAGILAVLGIGHNGDFFFDFQHLLSDDQKYPFIYLFIF